MAAAALIYSLFVGGQLLFRLAYYGQFVPNTYVLKVLGVPFSAKLRWGLDYIWPFLVQSVLLLEFAFFALLRSKGKHAALILFLPILLGYLISIGGDAFPPWRILGTSNAVCLYPGGIGAGGADCMLQAASQIATAGLGCS